MSDMSEAWVDMLGKLGQTGSVLNKLSQQELLNKRHATQDKILNEERLAKLAHLAEETKRQKITDAEKNFKQGIDYLGKLSPAAAPFIIESFIAPSMDTMGKHFGIDYTPETKAQFIESLKNNKFVGDVNTVLQANTNKDTGKVDWRKAQEDVGKFMGAYTGSTPEKAMLSQINLLGGAEGRQQAAVEKPMTPYQKEIISIKKNEIGIKRSERAQRDAERRAAQEERRAEKEEKRGEYSRKELDKKVKERINEMFPLISGIRINMATKKRATPEELNSARRSIAAELGGGSQGQTAAPDLSTARKYFADAPDKRAALKELRDKGWTVQQLRAIAGM